VAVAAAATVAAAARQTACHEPLAPAAGPRRVQGLHRDGEAVRVGAGPAAKRKL